MPATNAPIRFPRPSTLLAAAGSSWPSPRARPAARPRTPAPSPRSQSETIRTYPFSDPDPVPIFARSSMWGQGARLYPYFLFDRLHGRARRQALDGRPAEESLHRGRRPAPGRRQGLGARPTRPPAASSSTGTRSSSSARSPCAAPGPRAASSSTSASSATPPPRRPPSITSSAGTPTAAPPASSGRWTCPRGPAGASRSRLPKDSAAFETNALWVNPTPFSQSYYAWSCAAIKTAEDLKYIFPGQWSIGHDYSVPLEPWPVDRSGRDLSWYRQQRHARLQELLHRRRIRRFLRRLVREVRRRLRPLVPLRGHARPQGLDLGPVALGRDLGRPPDRQRTASTPSPRPGACSTSPTTATSRRARPTAGRSSGSPTAASGRWPRPRPTPCSARLALGRNARARALPAPARRRRPRSSRPPARSCSASAST